MDDPRTQEALDSLADLFLTQALGGKAAPVSEGSEPSGQAAAAPARDMLEGPSPIRLSPKVTHPASPVLEEHANQINDAPPSFAPQPAAADTAAPPPAAGPVLRYTGDAEADAGALTAIAPANDAVDEPIDASDVVGFDEAENGSDDHTTKPVSAEAIVEAVVLGNLPGMAGPWLTQYAQLLADQAGPVLVLHVDEDDASLDAGQVDLELVEPSAPDGVAGPRGSVRIPPMRGNGPDLVLGLIDSMVRARVGKVSTILVHLEAGTDERRLNRLLAIDDWTLLTGSDDPAVVAAYSMLKKLGEADARVAQKQVALMMMGCNEAAGHAAAEKIAQAADAFLHTPTLLLGSHQRLGPVNVRQLGAFGELGALWPRLIAYLDDLSPPEAAPPEVTPPEVTPESASPASAGLDAPPEPPPQPTKRDPAFESIIHGTPKPASEPTSVRDTMRVPAPVSRIAVPATNRSLSTPPDTSTASPRLAELVQAGAHGITGGIALEARCPYQPKTELVLDHAGRLHLLRRELPPDPDAIITDESAGIRAAVVDLVEAGKWVREHLELLKLTMREADFDTSAEPSLHLFTDKAHLATPIVAKLGDQVKLHLLQEVQVGPENAWFCTPLN